MCAAHAENAGLSVRERLDLSKSSASALNQLHSPLAHHFPNQPPPKNAAGPSSPLTLHTAQKNSISQETLLCL